MNAQFGTLLFLPALVMTLPQATQEPKPAPVKPKVTVVLEDEKDAAGNPRRFSVTEEQITSLSPDPALVGINGMRVINGALYTIAGGQLMPLPGGGASGCFDPDGEATRTKLAAAKLEWIRQISATPSPTPMPEKK